jgi:hypothetical protein
VPAVAFVGMVQPRSGWDLAISMEQRQAIHCVLCCRDQNMSVNVPCVKKKMQSALLFRGQLCPGADPENKDWRG